MTEQKNQTSVVGGADPLVEAAERRLQEMNKWWHRLWDWHNWLTGITVILAGLVPFGLALLLYIPPADARALNITLIVLTACGFVAQIWDVTQHNRERGQHLRSVAANLEMALVSFRSGLISREEFAKELREAFVREAQEPGV